MAIIFFGNEKLATGVSSKGKTLDTLLKNNYDVAKIYTKYQSDFSQIGIPISTSVDLEEISRELEQLKPTVGVLVAYGLIIPKNIIDIFPHGIINIHPSLLPKGRGPAPIEETLLDGSSHTGVTIMRLSDEMDKGPILAQESISLSGKETKQELADRLLDLGNGLLINCLEDIFSTKSIKPVPQAEPGATYTHKIKKSDGMIDWNKSAVRIEREIRAYAGWPKSTAELNGVSYIITKAAVVSGEGPPGSYESAGNSLIVFTSKEGLSIKRIKPAGKKDMSVEEFLRGYESKL